MRRLSAMTIAATAMIALSANAMAECKIQQSDAFSKQLQNIGSQNTRSDLNTLRNAAEILKENKKDDACQVVVNAIEEIRTASRGDKVTAATTTSPQRSDRARADDTDKVRRSKDAKSAAQFSRLRASKLMGADLRGPNGDEIAEIEDIVLNKRGENYVIVSFGGFLGVGDEQAAVPLSQIQVVREEGDDDVELTLPMSVKELKQAPRFKKSSTDWFENDEWWTSNDGYYSGLENSKG